MRVLHLFYLRDYKKEIQFSNVSEYIDETWSKIDISYRFALVTELICYGFWLLPCISSCFQSGREHAVDVSEVTICIDQFGI